MILDRRELLTLLGLATAGATVGGCGARWRVPEELVERALRGPGLESFERTICGQCESGCGLTVRLVDGLPVGLKGNPDHPLNRGGLCPVGQAGLEVLYAPDRLSGPLRRDGEGGYRPVAWEEALGEVAERLAALRERGEGHRFALLNGEPGQLFGELADRVAHALGSPNVARSPRHPTLAYGLSQGLDQAPGFDLRHADLVVSFGLDLYEDGPAPVHAIAALVGSRRDDGRAGLVHVGTRLSPSASNAERWVPVRPGTHAAFALGVAHVLVREGRYDRRFVAEHTSGFDDWTDGEGRRRMGFRRLLLERYYPDRAARLCGCDASAVVAVARRLAGSETPLAVSGGEAVLGTNATWTAFAVHALNALLGAFDRPGGVVVPEPVSLTPLPVLPDAVVDGESIFAGGFKGGIFGSEPLATLADGLLADPGRVEVLLVAGADPLHESPAADRLRQALAHVPLVVTLTPFFTETAAAGHYVLPTHLPLEAWREATTPPTVGFSTLGIGHPVIEPLGDTRHPGDLLLELARRAGAVLGDEPPWEDYEGYLEHRIAGLAAAGQGTVASGPLEDSWIQFLEERGWRFLQHTDPRDLWKDLEREGVWWNPVHPPGNWGRLFPTASGRFELFSYALEERLVELGRRAGAGPADVDALAAGCTAAGLAAEGDEACLPHYEPPRPVDDGELVLVPFRPITARGPYAATSPMVLEMFGYPVLTGWRTWAEISPASAEELDLHDGDRVALESQRGTIEAVVRVHPGVVAGVVQVPLGLGRTGDGGAAHGANPVTVLEAATDDLSGAFALAATGVRVRLLERRPHGGPASLEEVHA